MELTRNLCNQKLHETNIAETKSKTLEMKSLSS